MALYTTESAVNAVVAEIGGYATKIGYAGEDCPRSYFRSVRPRTSCGVHGPWIQVSRVLCCLFSFSSIILIIVVVVVVVVGVSIECRSLTGRRRQRYVDAMPTSTD